MKYVVDSCIWIDFFTKKKHFESVSNLLIDDLAYVNQIILSELLPSARLKKENEDNATFISVNSFLRSLHSLGV